MLEAGFPPCVSFVARVFVSNCAVRATSQPLPCYDSDPIAARLLDASSLSRVCSSSGMLKRPRDAKILHSVSTVTSAGTVENLASGGEEGQGRPD